MTKKRLPIIILLLVLSFAVCLGAISGKEAFAEQPVVGDFTITQSNGEAMPGEHGEISFSISEGSNVSGFAFSIAYDATMITVDEVKLSAALVGELVVNTTTPGQIIANYVGEENLTEACKLFIVKFTLSADAQLGDEYSMSAMDNYEAQFSTIQADNTPATLTGGTFRFGVIRVGLTGDVNGDGKVNARDLLIVQRAVVRLVELDADQKAIADINGDGVVNTTDAQYVKMYLVNRLDSLVINEVQTALDEEVYTVTFVGAGGTILEVQSTLAGGDIVPPDAPEVEGYTFEGWNSEAYNDVTQDVSIYAVYTAEKFTVQFMDEDGTTLLFSQEVAYGGTAKAPAAPEKAATDTERYNFVGWDVEFDNITEDLTVTAVYDTVQIDQTKLYYTVRFVDIDGTLLSNQSVEHGKAATIPTCIRPGYVLKTWTAKTASGAAADTTPDAIRENVTFTAVYTAKTYTVRFVDYDFELLNEVKIGYGGAAIAPPAPSREGYAFAGWSAETSGITADLTVIAQYRQLDTEEEAIQESGTYYAYDVSFVSSHAEKGQYDYTYDLTLTLAEDEKGTLAIKSTATYNDTLISTATVTLDVSYLFMAQGNTQITFVYEGYEFTGNVLLYPGVFEIDIDEFSRDSYEATVTTEVGTYEYLDVTSGTTFDGEAYDTTEKFVTGKLVLADENAATYTETQTEIINGETIYDRTVVYTGTYEVDDDYIRATLTVYDESTTASSAITEYLFTCYTDGSFVLVSSSAQQQITFSVLHTGELIDTTYLFMYEDVSFPEAPAIDGYTFSKWVDANGATCDTENTQYVGLPEYSAIYVAETGAELTIRLFNPWTGEYLENITIQAGEVFTADMLPVLDDYPEQDLVFKGWLDTTENPVEVGDTAEYSTTLTACFETKHTPVMADVVGEYRIATPEKSTIILSLDDEVGVFERTVYGEDGNNIVTNGSFVLDGNEIVVTTEDSSTERFVFVYEQKLLIDYRDFSYLFVDSTNEDFDCVGLYVWDNNQYLRLFEDGTYAYLDVSTQYYFVGEYTAEGNVVTVKGYGRNAIQSMQVVLDNNGGYKVMLSIDMYYQEKAQATLPTEDTEVVAVYVEPKYDYADKLIDLIPTRETATLEVMSNGEGYEYTWVTTLSDGDTSSEHRYPLTYKGFSGTGAHLFTYETENAEQLSLELVFLEDGAFNTTAMSEFNPYIILPTSYIIFFVNNENNLSYDIKEGSLVIDAIRERNPLDAEWLESERWYSDEYHKIPVDLSTFTATSQMILYAGTPAFHVEVYVRDSASETAAFKRLFALPVWTNHKLKELASGKDRELLDNSIFYTDESLTAGNEFDVENDPITTDLKLYAATPVITIDLSLITYLPDGTVADKDSYVEISYGVYTIDESIMEFYSRPIAWYTDKDFTTLWTPQTAFEAGSTIDYSITLYGKTTLYPVHLLKPDGTVLLPMFEDLMMDGGVLPELVVDMLLSLGNWYTDAECTELLTITYETAVDGEITLYCDTPTCIVAIQEMTKEEDGTYSTYDDAHIYGAVVGQGIIAEDENDSIYEKYSFYSDSACTTPFEFTAQTTFSADTTIYCVEKIFPKLYISIDYASTSITSDADGNIDLSNLGSFVDGAKLFSDEDMTIAVEELPTTIDKDTYIYGRYYQLTLYIDGYEDAVILKADSEGRVYDIGSIYEMTQIEPRILSYFTDEEYTTAFDGNFAEAVSIDDDTTVYAKYIGPKLSLYLPESETPVVFEKPMNGELEVDEQYKLYYYWYTTETLDEGSQIYIDYYNYIEENVSLYAKAKPFSLWLYTDNEGFTQIEPTEDGTFIYDETFASNYDWFTTEDYAEGTEVQLSDYTTITEHVALYGKAKPIVLTLYLEDVEQPLVISLIEGSCFNIVEAQTANVDVFGDYEWFGNDDYFWEADINNYFNPQNTSQPRVNLYGKLIREYTLTIYAKLPDDTWEQYTEVVVRSNLLDEMYTVYPELAAMNGYLYTNEECDYILDSPSISGDMNVYCSDVNASTSTYVCITIVDVPEEWTAQPVKNKTYISMTKTAAVSPEYAVLLAECYTDVECTTPLEFDETAGFEQSMVVYRLIPMSISIEVRDAEDDNLTFIAGLNGRALSEDDVEQLETAYPTATWSVRNENGEITEDIDIATRVFYKGDTLLCGLAFADVTLYGVNTEGSECLLTQVTLEKTLSEGSDNDWYLSVFTLQEKLNELGYTGNWYGDKTFDEQSKIDFDTTDSQYRVDYDCLYTDATIYTIVLVNEVSDTYTIDIVAGQTLPLDDTILMRLTYGESANTFDWSVSVDGGEETPIDFIETYVPSSNCTILIVRKQTN